MDILLNKLALDLTGLQETKEEALEERKVIFVIYTTHVFHHIFLLRSELH
jgi:hypothetical protein